MRLANDKLKSDILASAKEEFLAHGYLGAQLREIAAKAGVTTGAVYKYYRDKEALFDELVQEPADNLLNLYKKVQADFAVQNLNDQIKNLPEVSEAGQLWIINYMYDNFDTFTLIARCADGTKYAHYMDEFIRIEADASRRLIEQMQREGLQVKTLDDDLIHIVSSMLFYGMLEPLRHGMPREKATDYLMSLHSFYSAGWFRLLGIKR